MMNLVLLTSKLLTNIIHLFIKFIQKYLVVIFFVISFPFLISDNIDPDTFWHIRLGEKIFLGQPFENDLTYTCQNYLWINHSWLGSILIYLTHKIGDFLLLHLLVAFILSVGIWINLNSLKFLLSKSKIQFKSYLVKVFFYFFFFLSCLTLLSFFLSARPQVFNFLFVSILFNILLRVKPRLNFKIFFFVFILSILWINLHGGFIFGLGIVGLFILSEFVILLFNVLLDKHYEFVKLNLFNLLNFTVIITTMLLGSLFSIYGTYIWFEILNAILSTENYNFIIEWMPLPVNTFVGLFYLVSYLIVLILLAFFRNFQLLLIVFIAGFLPIMSTRYLLGILPVVVVPMFYSLACIFNFLNSRKLFFFNQYQAKIFKKVFYIVFFTNFLFFSIYSILSFSNNLTTFYLDSMEKKYSLYPIKIANYIRSNLNFFNDNVFFNEYFFGGFLLFYLPEIKWFVDGRMPTWKCPSILSDKKYFIYDYIDLVNLNPNNFETLLYKYSINAALVFKDSQISTYLRKAGWNIIIEDNVGILFIK